MSKNGNQFRYEVELVRSRDGVGFGRREVPAAYLESAREQVIFAAQRQGRLAADSTGIRVGDSPIFSGDAQHEVQGIEMFLESADGADGPTLAFDTGLFQSFTERVRVDLLNSKLIAASDDVHVRVFAENDHVAASADSQTAVVRNPLPLLEGNIDRLLPQSETIGPASDGDYPVFVAQTALEQAHEFVWQRNRERGVWLVGNLYRQREPHDIFAIVRTVFEARGTKHERFSLDFSTETFTHVQQQLQLSRTRFGRTADVLLGFYHTHPFLPSILDGMEACPTCSLRPTCKLTSSFFSQRDQAFHAAMFGSAAYAVEIVLGLTPREEFDLKMFCCDGGQFRERGYYRLAEVPAGALSDGGTVA